MATRFGAYEILYELKAGGMGAVLLARRRGPGRFEQLVAIKTIRSEHAGSPQVRAMFLDEARILAGLGHANVAAVHDFGEEGGTLYMAMEYVAGISFRDLHDLRPPPAVLARAIAEAARGLHAAHELCDLTGTPLGLVHRDRSPENLMLGYDGHVKVIDFGIALFKNRQAQVTEFGMLKGKPPYMSPEQVKNEAMDRRSDVFSLAIVLWELLTGKHLFEGDSLYAIAYAVEHQDIARPSQVLGEPLPVGLDAAVMNALDRNLESRTPSAAAFAEQLDEVIQLAGGESLAAWANQALAAKRDEHRGWIASIVAGAASGATPEAAGRAPHTATEPGDGDGPPPVAAAPVERGQTGTTSTPTSIGPEASAEELAVPRRRAPVAIAVLALLVAGGVALFAIARRSHPAAAPRDALAVTPPPPPVDAPLHVMLPPADAAVADAPRPVDAAPRVVRHHHVDAGRVHPVVVHRHDAAPALPTGTGYLTAFPRAGGSYVNVTVDGKLVGQAPMFTPNPIPAGRHTIELVDPVTNKAVLSETIDVKDGQHLRIQPH